MENTFDSYNEKLQNMRKQANGVFDLTNGFTTETTSNAMKAALEMAGYVLELTNDLSTTNNPSNTDGAELHVVTEELKRCAKSWNPKARLLGNVRSEDIVRLCNAYKAPFKPIHYDWMQLSDFPEPPDNGLSRGFAWFDQGAMNQWDSYIEYLLSFFKKHNIEITDHIREQFSLRPDEK